MEVLALEAAKIVFLVVGGDRLVSAALLAVGVLDEAMLLELGDS
jgi:hypothetical protein